MQMVSRTTWLSFSGKGPQGRILGGGGGGGGRQNFRILKKSQGKWPLGEHFVYLHYLYYFQRQVGFDEGGRPVIYSSFCQAATHRYSVEDSIVHITYLIENAKRSMGPGVSTWVWIIDCTGMYSIHVLHCLFREWLLQHAISLFQRNDKPACFSIRFTGISVTEQNLKCSLGFFLYESLLH